MHSDVDLAVRRAPARLLRVGWRLQEQEAPRRRQRRLFRRQRRQRLLKITCHRYRGPEPGGTNISNFRQTFKLVFTPEHRVEINPHATRKMISGLVRSF